MATLDVHRHPWAPAARSVPAILIAILHGSLGLAGCSTDPIAVAETRVLGGGDQVRLPGTTLREPLAVYGAGADGARVAEAGRPVTWTITSGGGTLVGAELETDARGYASATWRLGPSPGSQTVEVSIDGSAPAVFSAEAVEAGPIAFRYRGVSAMNADGTDLVILSGDDGPRILGEVAWSPDGASIVFARTDRLTVLDLATLAEARVGDNPLSQEVDFDWSPDGSTIVLSMTYSNEACGVAQTQLFTMAPDGSSFVLMPGSVCEQYESAPAWSPDGSRIAFQYGQGGGTDSEIWIMDADGSNRSRVVEGGRWPEWLPDGRTLVYGTRADFDGVSELRLVDSESGAVASVWTPPSGAERVRPGGRLARRPVRRRLGPSPLRRRQRHLHDRPPDRPGDRPHRPHPQGGGRRDPRNEPPRLEALSATTALRRPAAAHRPASARRGRSARRPRLRRCRSGGGPSGATRPRTRAAARR